ncbi:MAG: hypothetical protein AB8G18_12595 [Gammaproteobacteria bacterium]
MTVSSNAQMTGSNVESQLLLCAGRVTDSARLACYDGLVDSLRPAGSEAKADLASATVLADTEKPVAAVPAQPQVDNTTGTPVATAAKPPAKTNVESFGDKVEQKQSIRVMIEKTKRNARSDWYFYFDNGEVWKQIDSSRRRIPPLPVAATISRGIFSSHKLHIDGERWSIKIRRIK